MSKGFIIIAFAVIVIANIIFLVTKKRTISDVMRLWFKKMPLVPYMMGVMIGHWGVYQWNGLLLPEVSLWVFIGLSVIFLKWNIIEMILKNNSRLYNVMCRFFPIPMTLGILIGSFWT